MGAARLSSGEGAERSPTRQEVGLATCQAL